MDESHSPRSGAVKTMHRDVILDRMDCIAWAGWTEENFPVAGVLLVVHGNAQARVVTDPCEKLAETVCVAAVGELVIFLGESKNRHFKEPTYTDLKHETWFKVLTRTGVGWVRAHRLRPSQEQNT